MQRELRLRIVLERPPKGVDFGLQKGRGHAYETVQKQRSEGLDLAFDFTAGVKAASETAPNFTGPFVQGPPGQRFVYIDIGACAGQADSRWSRRLKVPLSGITTDMVDSKAVLECQVPGTAKDGGPNCAAVKPFGGWKAQGDPQFEAAADAIVTGDAATLERLLRDNPELIHARSTRSHHASLLHYVGSNGVEDFRQKTPPNIVEIAEILLKAGAEVDAAADMYAGGCTTLGLVATSIHPFLAGVLEPLIDLLLSRGAAPDGPGPDSIVNACLANGRPEGAELMADRGARLDLEGAAGVGRLDIVQSFFQEDGTLKTNATRAQLDSGFTWACEYGKISVVDFLLHKGVDLAARVKPHGQTGLHFAAYGAHAGIVRLLLDNQAPVDAQDETWHTTPLGWALYAWGEPPHGVKPPQYHEVVALLVAAGAQIRPEWLAYEKVRADPGMLAALR